MSGIHAREAYTSLKAATRRLISDAGGVESSAQITRANKSSLGNYQCNNADQFLPVDALIDLTKDTGNRVLLDQILRILEGVGVTSATAKDIKADVVHAHRESAEAIAAALDGLSDEKLSVRGLNEIIKEADEAADAFKRLSERAAAKRQTLMEG
jgi:hypothetical protein